MNAALSLFIITALLPVASAQAAPAAEASGPRQTRDTRDPTPSFPRLMGMNIGAKNYDDPAYQRQLARLDVVILGFYQGWKPGYGMAQVVRNLKELSGGKILLGQYTILNECGDDPKNSATLDLQTKLNDMDWWARKADGSRVQWTAQYRSWDINFTAGSRPDANGQRFPQWLAERDDRVFFKPVPFDLWYCDNVFFRPRVSADWNHVGADGDPKSPAVAAAYREGHRAQWDHIRRIHPGLPLMGNTDGDLSEPEYAGQLEGAFLEGLMGKSWSIETWGGWSKVMSRYHAAMANTRAPHLVGFNVHGDPTDYRFFRYAYASCLLDDGYFCFTAKDKEYSSVTWFDEFDFKLGAAVTQPPAGPWQSGVWRRDFERGIALVNPTKEAVTVTLDPGFCRLKGKQDPATNDGSPATSILLPARDGIILYRQSGQRSSGGGPLSDKEYLSAVLSQELTRYAGIEVPSRENIHVLADGTGQYLEFRLVPGQPKKNNGIRAEISVDYPYSVGEVVRYRWEMRLPGDFRADEPRNRWWVMGQWHDQPDPTKGETWQGFPAHSPPVSFNYGRRDGEDFLSLLAGSPRMKSVGLIPLTRDTWHKLDVVIKWSQGDDGQVAVFFDGSKAPAVTGTGPNMHNGFQHCLKLGMYRHPQISTENRLDIRNVLIEKLKDWPVVESR